MRHCLAHDPDDLDDPAITRRNKTLFTHLHSLRDPDNHPHVTFYVHHDEILWAQGKTNTPPKPEYLERIEAVWPTADPDAWGYYLATLWAIGP